MTFLGTQHLLKPNFCFTLSVVITALIAGEAIVHRPAHAQADKQVTTVSAASYEAPVAPESIVSAFGSPLATSVGVADTLPLPTTLAGTTVKVKDSERMERLAPLFFVAPTQINYLIPAGTASGEAAVTITNSDGAVSIGKVQIAQVAPALFTANASGRGVAAAVVLRIKPNGKESFEPVARPDRSQDCFVHAPIDLNPIDDRVFLLLYGTGLRLPGQTIRVLLGGEIRPTAYAPVQGLAGLDQINVELPRTLIGRGVVECTLTVDGLPITSNPVTIEIAPPPNDVNSPRVAGFSPTTVLAGTILTINGMNFDPVKEKNLVLCGCTETRTMEEASETRLSAKVPFGTASGKVAVRTSRGQGESTVELIMSTSISGYVENTASPPLPLPGMLVRVPGYSMTSITDKEGTFVLPIPGVPPTSALAVEIVPPVELPYTLTPIKASVTLNRDNHAGRIRLQQTKLTGQNALPFGLSDPPAMSAVAAVAEVAATATQRSRYKPAVTALQSVRVIQESGIAFEIADNATAVFPGGGTSGTVILNLVEQSRTPVELPPGVFSSTIAQLTPFRVKLTPGGKLIFPNRDMLPVGSQPKLYRFDQTIGSPTFGTFVEAGAATVSASGGFIETLPTAITETSIYLAAVPRRVTTVVGRVIENDGATPVRGANARANGQEAITDGNGGFTLRNVSVPDNTMTLIVEASIQRPNGRVDRAPSPATTAVLNGVTPAGNLVLPPLPPNRPPVVVAPSSLEVTEGLVLQATVLAYDPDSDRPLQMRLDGPPFARLDPDSNNANTYTLRLAPQTGSAPTFMLTITGMDIDGASASQVTQLAVKANRPPTLVTPALRFATPGQSLSFIISATDFDNTQPGIVTPQTFTFSFTNAPPGATLTPQPGGMSARFDWTPAATGTFTPSFTAIDNGTPPLGSGSRSTTIIVGLPWARTGSIEAAQTFALLSVGSNLYAGTSGGVFVSADQGGTWNERNTGLTTLHVNTLASSSANLLAGTNGGGVFRSSDNGRNWTNCGSLTSGGITYGVVRALAVSGQDHYAGTFGGGIFHSTNACSNWAPINDGLGNSNVTALILSGTTLFAGTEGGGVFRKLATDQSWQQVKEGLSNLKVRALAVSGLTVLAGTDGSGIFCSANGGQNWALCNTGFTNPNTTINALVVNAADVFACTSGDGVYRSSNQGMSWIPLGRENEGLRNPFVSSIAINTSNPLLLLAGTAGGGVFRSTDQGQNWTAANNGMATSTINALTVSGSTLYAGTAGGGVFSSTNQGQTWTLNSGGLTAPYVNAFAIIGETLFAATNGGVFSSPLSANPLSWTPRVTNLPGQRYAIALIAVDTTLYVGIAPNGGVYRSDNQGGNWNAVNTGLADRNIQSLTAIGLTLLAGTENSGIFRSTDGGQNWAPANAGLTGLRVHALTTSGATFYAGTDNGVHRSTDQGQSWAQLSAGMPDRAFVKALLVTGSNFYAGIFGGLYFSIDQGQNWAVANPGLTHNNVFSLTASGANLFAGTIGGGVYLNTSF